MFSLTQRIDDIYQPIGGYINKNLFDVKEYGGNYIDSSNENLKPNVVGMVVDYLTRLYYADTDNEIEDVFLLTNFAISSYNTKIDQQIIHNKHIIKTKDYLCDEYIIAMCKLAPYDAVYRAGLDQSQIKLIEPDSQTIDNIRELTQRSINYLGKNKFKIITGFKFPDVITRYVSKADGDFIKSNTIIDLKVSNKHDINQKQSLQIYGYYLMSQLSNQSIFKYIDSIATFNPRYNVEHFLKTIKISYDIKYYVMYNVFGVDLNEK